MFLLSYSFSDIFKKCSFKIYYIYEPYVVPREERKNNTDEQTAPTKVIFISFISSSKPLTPGSTTTFHYRMTHSATTAYTHYSRTKSWAFCQRELSITHNTRSMIKLNPFFIFLRKTTCEEPAPLHWKNEIKHFHNINVTQWSQWQKLHK